MKRSGGFYLSFPIPARKREAVAQGGNENLLLKEAVVGMVEKWKFELKGKLRNRKTVTPFSNSNFS